MVLVCVVAGAGLGTFVHARRVQAGTVTREEMLRRGAHATTAASAVQGAVRIGERPARISRVLCSNAPDADWSCTVRFRSVPGGDELTGPDAPSVEVAFRGRDHVALRACRLREPQHGLDVDCAKSARAALAAR